MKRIKTVGVCLTAMFAINVAVASSASASPTWHVEKAAIAASTPFTGSGGASTLEIRFGKGSEFVVNCQHNSLTGNLETAGSSSATLMLESCVVSKPLGCVVSSTIRMDRSAGQLVEVSGVLQNQFTGEGSSHTWILLEITQCALKGKYAITGTQLAELPGVQTEAIEHEFVFKPAGSTLRLGTSAVTLELTNKVKLSSGKKWSAQK